MRSRSTARAPALFALTLLSCGPPRVEHPSEPPPALTRPPDAIPADLDAALRVDLAAARRLFGERFTDGVDLHIADAAGDPPGAELLADALARADTAWFAFRPGLRPELTDNVVVLRGRFGDLSPREYSGAAPWGAPRDLGADIRVFDRPDPGRRAAPRRLYARSDEILVFVSEAEIDSVERRLERGEQDDHLDPPDRGAASLAVRLPAVARFVEPEFPAVSEVFEEATILSGHATVDGIGLRAVIEVRFQTDAAARRAERAAGQLLRVIAAHPSAFGLVARATEPSLVAHTVVLRTALGPEAFGQVLACADDRAHCE